MFNKFYDLTLHLVHSTDLEDLNYQNIWICKIKKLIKILIIKLHYADGTPIAFSVL